MFLIKRVTDTRLSERICGAFGVEQTDAVVYGAFRDGDVLATAVFLEEEGDCFVLEQIDTGRRLDADLADGIARAAFNAGRRTGIRRGRLGDNLPQALKLALSKRGYEMNAPFALAAFFSQKNCKR